MAWDAGPDSSTTRASPRSARTSAASMRRLSPLLPSVRVEEVSTDLHFQWPEEVQVGLVPVRPVPEVPPTVGGRWAGEGIDDVDDRVGARVGAGKHGLQ